MLDTWWATRWQASTRNVVGTLPVDLAGEGESDGPRMIAPGPAARHTCRMPADTFAAFYARYVEQCQRAGVEPVTAERAARLLAELGALSPLPAAAFVPASGGGNRH